LLSLLAHSLLLSLTLGGDHLGLPGFAFPWLERRVAVPDLRLVLLPPPVANVAPSVTPDDRPLPQALAERSAPAKPVVNSSAPPEPALAKPGLTVMNRSAPADRKLAAPKAKPKANSKANPKAKAKAKEKTKRKEKPKSKPATAPPPAPPPARAKAPRPAKPFPPIIALEKSETPEFVVPKSSARPTPADAAAAGEETSEAITPDPGDAGMASQERVDQPMQKPLAESAPQDQSGPARQQAAAKAESARPEAERLLAAQQEAARQAAEKLETARQEAARQDAVKQAAALQEAIRQESVRQEAAARATTAREAAAREATAREATAREAAGRQEAARADEAIREQNARRDAARRAMGRQLDEEADRRDAARAASRLSPSSGYLRRGRLFGRIDSNGELVKYAEAVSRKIHFNSASDTVFALAKQAHNPPMVTLAIRSDGSVESVTFVASSGVPAIDDAIRRIVQSQAPYPPFPPGLTRDYDVLEIRRTWHIDTAIRLY
jgi:hypothetical protein